MLCFLSTPKFARESHVYRCTNTQHQIQQVDKIDQVAPKNNAIQIIMFSLHSYYTTLTARN